MSILLDALKRSESQRELGSVPTLQTSTDAPAMTGAKVPVWANAVMVLLAFVLMTWLGLQQFRLPDEAPEPTLALQPPVADTEKEPAGTEAQETSAPEAAKKSILPTFTGAKVLNSDRANAAKAKAEAEAAAKQTAGQNVRDYQAADQIAAAPTASTDSSEPTRDNAIRQSDLASVEIPRRDQAASSTAADEYEPEMISYWQVPEAMREGLSDLRISVLVFAEQPENRFVLLNGQRLREGEELDNGLLLEEIRRDRAIFSYRNYRFYLKG
jgi:general secretion pathway protein B